MTSNTPTTFTLDASMIEGLLAEIKATDDMLTALSGTIVQKRKEAHEANEGAEANDLALWTNLAEFVGLDGGTIGGFHRDVAFLTAAHLPILAGKRLAEVLADLTDLKSTLAQSAEDNLVARLTNDKVSFEGEAGPLLRTRDSLVTKAKAMGTLLGLEVAVPSAPKVSVRGVVVKAGGSTGPRTVKTGRILYGVREKPGGFYANVTLSGVAYYAFRAENASTEDLKSALKAAGVEYLAKPFEAKVTIGNTTKTVFAVMDDEATEEATEDAEVEDLPMDVSKIDVLAVIDEALAQEEALADSIVEAGMVDTKDEAMTIVKKRRTSK